jgi:hypothetical protein
MRTTREFVTCYKIPESYGAQRDEGVVQALDEGPTFEVHEDSSGKEDEDDKSRNQVENDISHHTSARLSGLRLVAQVHSDKLQCFVSNW